jgi:hypothetical protein
MSIWAHQKPFLEAWLKRTGRELALSGKLSEVALILSAQQGGEVSEWRSKLQSILNKEVEPDFELLTQIDSILSRPSKPRSENSPDAELF